MGNACLSGAVNAPKRGEWSRRSIFRNCRQCGAELWIQKRGARAKKFCNLHCATTYNMAVKFDALDTKRDAIEQCLCCHDKILMKQEMSAKAVAEKKGYIARRRRQNGFDWRKVSSMASRAHHLASGTMLTAEEKIRRAQEWAWAGEWKGVTDCHYANYWHNYLHTGARRRALWRKRYKVDPAFTCKRMLRNQVARIKRRTTWSKRSNELLGCTYAEARKWIESQFKKGMTWANCGEWEIDHIIPIAAFDLTDERQVMCVNHYTNLRPLWAHENRLKRDRIERPHQLALL
jgi:hypothetical protein